MSTREASDGVTRIILITGAPGVGKTTVAELLGARLKGTTARLCGDVFILAVAPFEVSDDRRLFLRRNLASFAQHSIAHKYDWVVLDCVIPSDRFIVALRESIGIPPGRFFTFALLADREAYEARLREKTHAGGACEPEFEACHAWMNRIRRLTLPTALDSTGVSAEQTAREILRRVDPDRAE